MVPQSVAFSSGHPRPTPVVEHKALSAGALVGGKFVDFELVLLDGTRTKLSEFTQQDPDDKPVVVAFYASWCEMSRTSAMELEGYAQQRPDVRWLLLSVEQTEGGDGEEVPNVQAAIDFQEEVRLMADVVTHGVVVNVPEEYALKYVPHHTVIGSDGVIQMNYDFPSRNFAKFI
eukprot:TRINITY_DN24247_c0_g1_i1.p1 TRINITY_DN24247_c0_g1~~TRINITY_DN24247_c0_g1_i1.p1  ORF type:complete len:174 (-),score=49.51 TRINITY_DN24247_c0_g1_i1:462-983(-)